MLLCSSTHAFNIQAMNYHSVRFLVLTAASMKMNIFWVVASCIIVEIYRRLGGSRSKEDSRF
jgi:hypothetical protein